MFSFAKLFQEQRIHPGAPIDVSLSPTPSEIARLPTGNPLAPTTYSIGNRDRGIKDEKKGWGLWSGIGMGRGGAEIGEPMKGKGRRIVDGIRESGEL